MARFNTLAKKGTAPRLRGVTCSTLEGVEFVVDFRLLNGLEEETAVGRASKRAKELCGTDSENDINFQFAYGVEAILAGVLDPESTEDAPEQFFDSVEQIRNNLDRERILFLAETQRAYQESKSPRTMKLNAPDYVDAIAKFVAEDDGPLDDHPFWRWPRSTQTAFLRFVAEHLVKSASTASTPPTDSAVA